VTEASIQLPIAKVNAKEVHLRGCRLIV